MLNFEVQIKVLEALRDTYLDERAIEINSADLKIAHEEFIFNLQFLKREKLIDLSSLRNKYTRDDNGVEGLLYVIARCHITHEGFKALAKNENVQFTE